MHGHRNKSCTTSHQCTMLMTRNWYIRPKRPIRVSTITDIDEKGQVMMCSLYR